MAETDHNDVAYVHPGDRKPQPVPGAPEHPEDICKRCEGRNITWFAPSILWNHYVRANSHPEIICPICFVELCLAGGYQDTAWKVEPQQLPNDWEQQVADRAAQKVVDIAVRDRMQCPYKDTISVIIRDAIQQLPADARADLAPPAVALPHFDDWLTTQDRGDKDQLRRCWEAAQRVAALPVAETSVAEPWRVERTARMDSNVTTDYQRGLEDAAKIADSYRISENFSGHWQNGAAMASTAIRDLIRVRAATPPAPPSEAVTREFADAKLAEAQRLYEQLAREDVPIHECSSMTLAEFCELCVGADSERLKRFEQLLAFWPNLIARAGVSEAAVWNEAIEVVKSQAFRWRHTNQIVDALIAARDKKGEKVDG